MTSKKLPVTGGSDSDSPNRDPASVFQVSESRFKFMFPPASQASPSQIIRVLHWQPESGSLPMTPEPERPPVIMQCIFKSWFIWNIMIVTYDVVFHNLPVDICQHFMMISES